MKDPFSDYYDQFKNSKELEQLMGDVLKYLPLRESIHKFWGEEKNLKTATWKKHLEINGYVGHKSYGFLTMTYTHELSAFGLCVCDTVLL